VTAGGVTRLSDALRVTLRWFPATNPSDIANCLARVATHEIGHTLGLFAGDHRDTEPSDLMAAFPNVREPSPRDRSTVEFLYHLPADILPRPRSGS
jgi:predicted Zn-dependent protease